MLLFFSFGVVPSPCGGHKLFLLSASIQLLRVTLSVFFTWGTRASLTPCSVPEVEHVNYAREIPTFSSLDMVTASGTHNTIWTNDNQAQDLCSLGEEILSIWTR